LAPGAATAPVNPPAGNYPSTGGSVGGEGWERYIAEERPNPFPFKTASELLTNPANLPYNQSGGGGTGMDDASLDNQLRRRDDYKTNAATWMNTAFGTTPETIAPVDAVIYPGFLTSVGNNDTTSAIFSSDRASGVITQGIGLPTAILPIGTNDEGQSNNVQIVGRAWDDAAVLGFGYAVEQQAEASVHTVFAPALAWSGPAESITALSLGSTATTFGSPTTAIVSVSSDPAAAGQVTVEVAGRKVVGSLSGGRVTVTLPKDVPVGTHLVTASYAGSSTVAPSVATARLKVAKTAPRVSIKLAKSTVKSGQRGQLRVRVDAPRKATIVVYDGSRIIRTVTVDAARTIRLPKLAAGRHTIRAYVVSGSEYSPTWSKKIHLRVSKKK
jgi:amidase